MSRILTSFAIAGLFAASPRAITLEGLPGTLFSPSAQPLGHLGLAVSLGAYGHQDESMIYHSRFYFREAENPLILDSAFVPDLESGSLRLNLALGLGRFVDIGISAPFYLDFIGDTEAKKLSGSGLGDPSLSLKAGHALIGDHILDAALLGTLTFPSKSPEGFLPKQAGYVPAGKAAGVPRFFSSYAIGGSLQSLWTLDLSRLESHPPFRGSINAGASHSGATGASPRTLLGGGVEWIPLPSLSFFGDVQSETRFSKMGSLGNLGKEFSYAAAGFSAVGEDGIFFAVSVQKSLPQRPFHAFAKDAPDAAFSYDARDQPSIAVAFNLGWSGALMSVDSDKDGIPDKEDLCITEPEDMDNFQDQDGCPELDNDGDSIYDASDKCPMEPEDLDGFQDDDGCPDPDNDKDGIPDLQDKCPSEPEDQDGFEDYDGCPELDNDKDGISDLQDKCPGIAEDKDGFEDGDGCPDRDNDQDQIPDVNDKCPNDPENYNGIEDTDGCPEQAHGSSGGAVPSLERRSLLRKVRFRGNTSDLMPESYASLDLLADQIKSTQGALVEIRGYVDQSGGELEGMRLSEARAVAVRKYLISQGVPADKMLARGMGSRDPIANNHTASGRLQNRRIEVHRLD